MRRIPSAFVEQRMVDDQDHVDISVLANSSRPEHRDKGTFRRARRSIDFVAHWLADRIEDAAAWLAVLVRYFPRRTARVLSTSATGLTSLAKLPPAAYRTARRDRPGLRPFVRSCACRGALRIVQLVFEALDLVGTPEILAFVWRMLARTSPLTPVEIAAAAEVLGPNALRYKDVRIAEGGVLRWIFKRNGQRAFATFHTINLPEHGDHSRSNLDIVVHELVHVYQYERAGSRYLAEALLGQRQEGYDYGGLHGLEAAVRQGKRLADFNREQQAQIAQDYRAALRTTADAAAFEPFIHELRDGHL